MKNKEFLFNKTYSQNFLHDKTFIQKIQNTIDVYNQNVIEIGPGLGCITEVILDKNPKKLTVIEKDFRLIDELRIKFPTINIIHNDCLKENINTDIIITNLPYSITNLFLFKLYHECVFNKTYIMLQKEVAMKLISKEFNVLSSIFQNVFDIKLLFHIHPQAFIPAPKVWSSFLEISYKNININKIKLLNLSKKLFEFKNKKLQNILKIEKDSKFFDVRPINLANNNIIELLNNF